MLVDNLIKIPRLGLSLGGTHLVLVVAELLVDGIIFIIVVIKAGFFNSLCSQSKVITTAWCERLLFGIRFQIQELEFALFYLLLSSLNNMLF